MSSGSPRRFGAEVRFGADRDGIALGGRRVVYEYWNLIDPYYGQVLLAPQWHAAEGRAAWSWQQRGDGAVAAGVLADLRDRLANANNALSDFAAIDPASAAATGAIRDAVLAKARGIARSLLAKNDAELAKFIGITPHGPRIHSWGAPSVSAISIQQEAGGEGDGEGGDDGKASASPAAAPRKGGAPGQGGKKPARRKIAAVLLLLALLALGGGGRLAYRRWSSAAASRAAGPSYDTHWFSTAQASTEKAAGRSAGEALPTATVFQDEPAQQKKPESGAAAVEEVKHQDAARKAIGEKTGTTKKAKPEAENGGEVGTGVPPVRVSADSIGTDSDQLLPNAKTRGNTNAVVSETGAGSGKTDAVGPAGSSRRSSAETDDLAGDPANPMRPSVALEPDQANRRASGVAAEPPVRTTTGASGSAHPAGGEDRASSGGKAEASMRRPSAGLAIGAGSGGGAADGAGRGGGDSFSEGNAANGHIISAASPARSSAFARLRRDEPPWPTTRPAADALPVVGSVVGQGDDLAGDAANPTRPSVTLESDQTNRRAPGAAAEPAVRTTTGVSGLARPAVLGDSVRAEGPHYSDRPEPSTASGLSLARPLPLAASFPLGPAPKGWGSSFRSADIGEPALKGSTRVAGHAITVIAGGRDIWGTADQFHFASQPQAGDFDVAVQLESLAAPQLYSRAGLMAREDLSPGSRHVFFLAFPDNRPRHNNTSGYELQYRGQTGGGSQAVYPPPAPGSPPVFPVAYPRVWLRLKRTGRQFTGYVSADGLNWRIYGSCSVDLPPNVLLGLAVTSHAAGAETTAVFLR